MTTRISRLALWLLFGLGLIGRLFAGFLQGDQNQEWWKAWTTWMLTNPITQIYGESDSKIIAGIRSGLDVDAVTDRYARLIRYRPSNWGRLEYPVTQPPLYLYTLGAVGSAYRAVTGGLENRRLFNWFINLITTASAIGIAWLTFLVSRRRLGWQSGILSALAFWLNPAVLLNGPILGDLDQFCGLFVVASVVALAARRHTLAVVLACVSVLAKPQGILLVPIVLISVVSAAGFRSLFRGLFYAGVTCAAILFPFLISGHTLSMGLNLFSQRRLMSLISAGGALSLWWPIQYRFNIQHRGTPFWSETVFFDELRAAGAWNPRVVGEILFLLLFGALCLIVARSRARNWRLIVIASATAYVAFYVLYPGTHQNYNFLALPLIGLIAFDDAETLNLYTVLSALFALTYFLFWGIGRDWNRMVELLTLWNAQAATLVLAACHCALLAAMMIALVRERARIEPAWE